METTVSLPSHLHSSLKRLLPAGVPPDDLRVDLAKFVKPEIEESGTEVPYKLLLRVSRWAEEDGGKAQIRKNRLDASDYSIIALLAGTMTSPSAKLGPYRRSPSPETKAIQRSKEKKAISAVINAALSIVGVGVAAWWAAASVGWRPEHKALLSVFSAMAVAIAEAVLYWIWQWRYDTALKRKGLRNTTRDKKDNDTSPSVGGGVDEILIPEPQTDLRRRQQRSPPTTEDK